MTFEEQVAEQNEAIKALAAGFQALIEELHEAGAVNRHSVADRLSRLRNGDGSPIPTVQALVTAIERADFASTTTRDQLGVIEGGKAD